LLSSCPAKSLLLNAFIWCISLSYGFSDWTIYRQQFLRNPDSWKLYLTGGVDAPWQYRIGPWLVVNWMDRLSHWKAYDTLTMTDVLCLAFALWVMLRVLRNSSQYQALSPQMRWLPLTAAFFLAEYYLAWTNWYQTCGTIPSILFVALSVALIDGRTVPNKLIAGVLLICLAWLQGWIRADVAVVLHAGFFFAAVFTKSERLPHCRLWQATVSMVAAISAGCVQLYLMRVKFPQAKYGPGGVVCISTNLHPGMWLTMLLALFPFWLLLGAVATKRYRASAITILLLTASVLYFAVWATVGLLDEVRIFLPFAFALIPATAMALTGWLQEGTRTPSTALAD
jgi:hypothetical protein